MGDRNGATTFSITTYSIMTLSIVFICDTQLNNEHRYAEFYVLFVFMLNVIIRRHDIQHNDTQHIGLNCDAQHNNTGA